MRVLKLRVVQTLVVESVVPPSEYDQFPVGPFTKEKIDEIEGESKKEAVAEGMTLEQMVTEAWVVEV